MVNAAPLTRDLEAEAALNQFLSTFGEPKKVKTEVIDYFRKSDKIPLPAELYTHLMDKRVTNGEILPQRAGILKALFEDSFTPEYTTGYLPKHREPLVMGLANLYVKEGKPKTPVWRIEGDISNLGGLNTALQKSAENLRNNDITAFNALLAQNGIEKSDPEAVNKLGRNMANRVLHMICQITIGHLQPVADVIPIRKGGDEISFIATMKEGVSEDQMRSTLKETQSDVAQLVVLSGLELIRHPKYPDNGRRSGVGVGLHMVDMRLHEPEVQHELIAQGIPASKDRYQNILHRRRGTFEITTPDMKNLADILSALSPPADHHTVVPDLNNPGSAIPDEQRFLNLKGILGPFGGKLSPAEKKAATGTHALVRKIDSVTGFPMFPDMQREQLPYFMANFGDKAGGAKLVNIDFNNVAGGNKLDEEIGDTMAHTYGKILLAACKKSGLSEYKHSITVHQGAQFAMLVPADTSPEQITRFTASLNAGLDEASHQPLKLNIGTVAAARRHIAENAELQKLYGAKGERLFDPQATHQGISIDKIISPKTHLAGANVTVAASDTAIDLAKPLGTNLRPLESETAKLHEKIVKERKANWEAIPKSFTSQLPANSNARSQSPAK